MWINNTKRAVFAIQIHHILTDGWSMTRMLNEIEQLYNIIQLRPSNSLETKMPSTVSLPLLNYALQQRSQETEKRHFETKLSFWKQYLHPIDMPAILPFDYVPRFPLTSAKADNIFFEFEVSLKAIANFCQCHEVTEFVLFLATLKVTLFLLGSLPDTCIGVAEANRLTSEFSDILGAMVDNSN